jgi:folate-binding protein YgfZ
VPAASAPPVEQEIPVAEPYAVWLDRDVVAAAGPEAATFLQGQLSQDILVLADGGSAWSWLLAPTGKVDALVRVSRLASDDWVLDTDRGWGDAVSTRLTRFKLRTKVELSARPWPVLGLRGAASDPTSAGPPGESLEVPAWPALTGVDLIGPAPAVPEGWPVMPGAEYEAIRIGAGIPKMGAELTDKTIPGETGLIEQTVSFTKGCYTGQELVARIDSRGGHVPRRLCLLVPAGPVEPGSTLVDGAGATAGTITSVAHSSATGWVALGYVRRGVEVPATLGAGPDGPEVEVRELPGGPARHSPDTR